MATQKFSMNGGTMKKKILFVMSVLAIMEKAFGPDHPYQSNATMTGGLDRGI